MAVSGNLGLESIKKQKKILLLLRLWHKEILSLGMREQSIPQKAFCKTSEEFNQRKSTFTF